MKHLHLTAPSSIFLIVGNAHRDQAFNELHDEVTWCADKQGALDIEYIKVGAIPIEESNLPEKFMQRLAVRCHEKSKLIGRYMKEGGQLMLKCLAEDKPATGNPECATDSATPVLTEEMVKAILWKHTHTSNLAEFDYLETDIPRAAAEIAQTLLSLQHSSVPA